MGYSSDILTKKIIILNRTKAEDGKYGLDSGGVKWDETVCLSANVENAKGKSAMNAGALDAYAVRMVRMRYTNQVTMRSRVVYNEQTYQIIPETFDADFHANTIQFHMQLLINDK